MSDSPFDKLTFTCKNCDHKNVCKYKEEFEEGKRIVENEAAVYEDVMYVSISCNYFQHNLLERGV